MLPVFAEMEHKTYKNQMLTVFISLGFCCSVYIIFAYLAINQYGGDIKVSILQNFANEDDYMTFVVQFLFFIVFVSIIPYNMYPGKLCIMNLVQEYKHRCFSRALEQRIRNNAERANNDDGYESYNSFNPVSEEENFDVIRETDDYTHNLIVACFALSIGFFACICDDLSIIFGMFAAFAECFNDFLLPSLLVFCALRYKRIRNRCAQLVLIGWFLVGVTYFFVANYYNLKKMKIIE